MEVGINIRPVPAWRIILLSGIIFLTAACCRDTEKVVASFSGIHPSEHVLLPMTPDFAIKTTGDTLNRSYPRLRTGNVFPLTGILRVDGKAYRFIGADSLRISSLASLSRDSSGWNARYSYLFPGRGWEQEAYNDSLWDESEGAFGPLKGNYPTHTVWGAENIYVRRHIKIADKELLKGHKVYIRYICDDLITFYCNGNYCFRETFTSDLKCRQLTEEMIAHIHKGDNVFAVYGRNTGGPALLDFGLYVENKMYSDADTATLKRMDVQATQTHYVFQCGEVELRIDFVSPSLSEKWDMRGWPVGFLSYEVQPSTQKQPEIEILFDVDTEWMSGKNEIDSRVENGWRIVQSDRLYLGMMADGTMFSQDNSHIVLSHKLGAKKGNKGVLLLGYGEGHALQYDGERLLPFWNRDGERKVEELLKSVGARYLEIKEECDKLDKKWNAKLSGTGDKGFVERMLLSYRDFSSSHRFMMSPRHNLFCFGDTLSNVREALRSFPSLLAYNRTDWMKGLLNPIFEYCESLFYIRNYPPYDMGLYPVAGKQEKLAACSEEAAANMLMMTAMIVEAEKDFSYAASHWKLLCLWADFLQERMAEEVFPVNELLSPYDERVKCVLGLTAFRKLIQMKETYE